LALQSEDLNRQKLDQCTSQLDILTSVTGQCLSIINQYESGILSNTDVLQSVSNLFEDGKKQVESKFISTVYSTSNKTSNVDAGEVDLF
jgi:hypothetical protein